MIFASSTQVGNGSLYAKSKEECEQLLNELSRDELAEVHSIRLPNVFGKWSRPNYNSAIATFCHNLANDLPIKVNDEKTSLELVYVDDLMSHICSCLLNAKEGRPVAEGVKLQTYSSTVGDVANQLREFHQLRKTIAVERVGKGLRRALYSTYLSFLDKNHFSYELPAHSDVRGVFVEMLKTVDSGQIGFFTSGPGVTRGGHFHHSKVEKFLVVSGEAVFRFKCIKTLKKLLSARINLRSLRLFRGGPTKWQIRAAPSSFHSYGPMRFLTQRYRTPTPIAFDRNIAFLD